MYVSKVGILLRLQGVQVAIRNGMPFPSLLIADIEGKNEWYDRVHNSEWMKWFINVWSRNILFLALFNQTNV